MTVSTQTLLLSLHALAKEQKAVATRLDSGDFDADDQDELNDDLDRLAKALGELAALYEPQREGKESLYPSTEQILALYN